METQRVDRLLEAMRTSGLDALFVSNPKNVQYVTGLKPMMGEQVQAFNDPEYFALIQPGCCDVLCDGRYFAEVEQKAGIEAQLLESPTSAQVIADKIKERLPAGAKTIGYEQEALLYGDAVALMEALKQIQWHAADELLADLRVRKSPAEIELLRKAQAITSDAFEHIAGVIRVGMTEREVALEIDDYLRRHSEGNSFKPIVAFGQTAANPHYLPSPDRRLEKGHLVLLDFGSIYEGYCGDLTRMICMGKADARQREVYDLVLEAQLRCLAGIKPGVTAHELDMICRDYFSEKECVDKFLHGTGHGVGLAIHEAPRIKQTFETRIEPGMVFTVEPGLYYTGWGGVRIEDMVAVSETGCDNLTTTSKKLLEWDA